MARKKKPAGDETPKKDAELFFEYLDRNFGKEDEIKRIESTKEGLPDVALMIYRDVPDQGMITGITYGMHFANHPDWKHGKLELILSVESQDDSWPLAMAWLAESFRNEKSFSYGGLFTMDAPISDESEMRAFFVFAPTILEKPNWSLRLSQYEVHLKQMYPIYLEEIEVFREMGLEGFWDHPHYDCYDVTRPNLGTD